MTSNITELQEPIHKAAKMVSYQWPGIVQADDLEQDITTKLLESPASVDKLLTEFGEKQRLNAIVKIGHQIAARERTDYEIFSGNFRYSVNEVKRLLEDRALHNESPELGSNWSISEDFRKSGGEFADAVNNKASAEVDLKRGMEKLKAVNSAYAEVIGRRYLNGEVFDKDDKAARSRLSRALTALTTNMNRSFKQRHAERPDGPGTRKAISVAQAKAISHKQYNGEKFLPNPGATDRQRW